MYSFNSSNFLGRCALECEKNEKCHGFFLYHNKDLDNVSLLVSNNMQNAVKLDVPLYVNTKLNTSLANFNN